MSQKREMTLPSRGARLGARDRSSQSHLISLGLEIAGVELHLWFFCSFHTLTSTHRLRTRRRLFPLFCADYGYRRSLQLPAAEENTRPEHDWSLEDRPDDWKGQLWFVSVALEKCSLLIAVKGGSGLRDT